MLIAGFSCVDFSGLNNRKKGLGDGGESDDTLRAILDYAEKFRPKIMILENVSGAPWKMLTETIMPGIGYAAHFLRVDTKDYYIPHTRVRGYMICIDTQIFHSPLGVIKKWENKMKNLRRPASSSIEAFLLEEDDPRIVHARAELSNTGRGEGRRTSEVDWARCHGRHQDYRAALNLGQKRPVMNWEDGGSCKAPDNMWRDWTVSQVERIWDTIDISWLRNLLRGFDHQYKMLVFKCFTVVTKTNVYSSRVLELSQNVDRVTDNAPTGFTGCLTPTGIPFSTLRGGPIIGLEALALQGLPIDKLQLTRESQSKLQDLAGNAMSSTVVGAAILSALISAYRGLPSGGNCMEADVQPILSPLHRQHDLAPFVADTSIYVPVSAAEILHMASLTVRLCLCEGRATVSKTAIQQCIDCNHTTCIKCGVDPSHDYKRMDPATIVQRKSPALFEKLIKEALPMKLTLVGIGEKDIFNLRPNTGKISKDRAWGIYSELIRKAFLSELRFNSVKRSQIWTVYYESDSARMELNIGHNRIEWRLFAKPTAIMAGEDPLRTLLAHPIARMRPEDSDLIKGSWQLWASETIALKATIEDVPEFIPSFENISGLGDFADTWVSQGCKITVSNKDTRIFDEDIRGEYKLLQNCAGPSGSLHVKMNPETFAPFYFFLDPDRIGNPEDDFFVFTNDRRRLTHDETRPRVARIESSWRQTKYNCKEDLTDPRKNEFKVSGSKDSFSLAPQHVANVTCYVDGSWLDISTAAFIPSGGETVSSMRHAPANFDIASFPNSCQSAHVVLSCQTTLPVGESSSWKKNTWLEVGQLHQKEFFSSFAWLMEKTHVLQGLDDWRQASDIFDLSCAKCAPSLPKMNWKLDDKAKLVPFEDPREAAAFEYALKSRPSPLVTQVFISDLGTMNLKISFNPETLIHRAVSNLQNPHQNVKVSWRLITDYTAPPKIHLPEFTIKNNDLDPPTTQPTGFKFSLRREQLRSLGWMLRQEADDIEPFVEEEVEEAEIAQIGWRGEGRATKPVLVRGGVLADQVGYGKTITSLALIDRQKEPDFQASKEEINGRVNLKATLVLIPQHLAKQWHDEIDKFFKIKPKIIEIGNTVSSLKKYTIKQFQDADIIIAPWSIFEGDEYLFLIAQFAGVVELPDKSSSRAQSAWYHNTLSDISEHVEKLKNGGRDLRTAVDAKYASQKSQAESVECIIPSKRLRGQAYLNEKLKLAGTKRKNKEISTGNKGSYTHLPTARGDPFGLQAIENGNAPWNSLKSPLLEMFQFSRIIVDEYTYISGKDSIIIPKLRAKARWILSGTPPIQDFADVKSISTFLGINLGINDFAAGVIKGINIKNLTKDLTSKFS
jgi:site-specific DNA-cytosine methylase